VRMVEEPEEKLTLAPNRELIEAIVRRDSKNRPAVHEAYEERNRRLEEEWKKPDTAEIAPDKKACDPLLVARRTALGAHKKRKRELEDAVGPAAGEVALHEAWLAYMQTGELEPLLVALPPSQALRQLILFMHEQAHPLPGVGKELARWGRANHVAAKLVEIQYAAWRKYHGRKKIPLAARHMIIDCVIEEMKGQAMRALWPKNLVKLKSWPKHAALWPDRPDKDTVSELLRKGKIHRL